MVRNLALAMWVVKDHAVPICRRSRGASGMNTACVPPRSNQRHYPGGAIADNRSCRVTPKLTRELAGAILESEAAAAARVDPYNLKSD